MTLNTMEFRQGFCFLWILSMAVLTASQSTRITHTCPDGWVLSDTKCYRIFGTDTLTSSTWENAYRVCIGNGAELVTIDDYFTNQNVGDFASDRNANKIWTGMSEKGVSSPNGINMTWNMNTAASIYQGRWSARNPDTNSGQCVYMEKKNGMYQWTVGNCQMKMPFVCQRTSCLQQSFHCDNGQCINDNWRCDGVDDCGDLSDEVDCPGRCSYMYNAVSTGRIQSPNHPQNYLPSKVCTWTFIGPEGSNIYLEFTSFNTEKGTDIVEILIGGRTESTATSIARLSGQPSLSSVRYRSYNNYMIVRFSTDSQTEKMGFVANFNSSRDNYPEQVYLTARNTESALEPPLFSSHGSNAYLGNQDYIWIIRAEERRKIVTLERMRVDLMGDDVIEIRDGDSGSAPLLEKYTASNNDNVDLPLTQSQPVMGKRFVFSTSGVMYIIMRTSRSTSGTGFSFHYKQGCSARYTADSGEITSPGFPDVMYANFQTCTWIIDIPSGSGFKLMLDRSKSFEIEDNVDFLEIFTNSTDDMGVAAHGTGQGFTTTTLASSKPFHSPNGKMFIRFKSTAIINKKGFRFLYSKDCPDPRLTSASTLNPTQSSEQLRQFNNEFTVSCQSGYSFRSDELNSVTVRMKCMFGGKWLIEQRTPTVPQCKPIYCGEPNAIDNGYISHSNGVVFGSFVTFTCFPGFTLQGDANVTCHSSGRWSNRPQCISASCTTLAPIINGQLSSSDNQYAAIVNYTCDAGYQLMGAPILFCQSSGQWTATAPQCIKTKCPIPVIPNGRVSSQLLPLYQETATVICDTGYKINGTSTITCQDDRIFGTLPTCINENECETSNGGCGQKCEDTVGSYYCTCGVGYTLNADKKGCDDINECETDNGGCSQTCSDKVGSYTCSCSMTGYVLFDVNGKSGYTIPSKETGTKAGDVYHIGHSCVRVNCSEPASVSNATLMTKRAIHRYMDKISYMCDLGYVKSGGQETFTCGENGDWTPLQATNLLQCTVATCPVENLSTLNLKNNPVLSLNNPVSYLDFLNMTCDVQGKGTFVNQRQCLYNKQTNTYALYGAPYECGVIDCGNPTREPGSSYSLTPASTTYGATFTFTCENLQTRKGASNSTNDAIVKCMADGNWDFGSLRCEGTTCPDPGYPRGGYLSGDVKGFQLDQVATFGCNLAGFSIPSGSALKCMLSGTATSLVWNSTVSTECEDTTNPTMSTCPGNMTLNQFSQISHNTPSVSDNVGIKTFEVFPKNANTTLVLENTPVDITYTVADFNGNQEKCSFTVSVSDEEPPKVTCPVAKTVYVTNTEITNFTVNPSEVVSTDNVGIRSTTYNPPNLPVSASFIGTVRTITVTATDTSGRTDQCQIQVYTAATPCSPHSLEKPLFGQKNCSAIANGFQCDLKCDQTYTFYEYPGQAVKTLTCSTGSPWSERIPACTPENQQALYTSLITMTYGVETTGQTIGPNCFENAYKSAISATTPLTEQNFKTGCSGGLFPNDNIDIDINEASSFSTATTSSSNLTIIYTVEQKPLGYEENSYSSCALNVHSRMQNFAISIAKISSQVPGCPNLVRTSAVQNSKGFICSSDKKKVTVDGKDYCLDCPAGTYQSSVSTCTLCPVNTFKGANGASACSACSSGLGTHLTGATTVGQCKLLCSSGTHSISGMPPCNQCRKNSYWVNSTHCEDCPNGGKTVGFGTPNRGLCIEKCAPGTFSYDGFRPCRSCPRNYYQEQEGATSCSKCADDKYTSNAGSSNVSKCIDATGLCAGLNCLNGGSCVPRFNSAVCECPPGYHGTRCEVIVNNCVSQPCYNDGGCNNLINSYTCTCPSGTTGPRCETDTTDDCSNSPCKNGGMCVNLLNTFRCLCADGFSGTTCESQTTKCDAQPCNTEGKLECLNFDNIRRICKCRPGYTGADCEININECASNPCLYGGTCRDGVNTYSCTCPVGYRGSHCEERVNPCSLNICNNGQCVDAYPLDNYRCLCNPGYSYGQICPYEMYRDNGTNLGSYRQYTNANVTFCRQQCETDARCQAFTFGAGVCLLFQTAPTTATFTSAPQSVLNIKKCNFPDDDYWSPWYDMSSPNGGNENEKRVQLSTYGINVCNGTAPIDAECRVVGTEVPSAQTGDSFARSCGVEGIECSASSTNPCEDYEVRYKCSVYKVFQGGTCNSKNFCFTNQCLNGGGCSSGLNDFSCSCPNGYAGKLCQHDIDSCEVNNCLNGGTCIDKPGNQGYDCKCAPGYTGPLCQSNIDECNTTPCSAVGSSGCKDRVNDFFCICKPGYTGKNCSIEINECESEPCMHGGNCTDKVADFQCSCPDGWIGKRCERIYDECQVNNRCPSSAPCLNIFKKSFCRCPKNTYGDVCENKPNICRDLSPCLNGATCEEGINTIAKCTCPNGDYRQIGCETMVNHCADPNKCENGGKCINLAPGFRCDCQPGYSGDNCSVNVDDCANSNCPSTSSCIDMVNAHYCRCPLGKTGDTCFRDLDVNYDMYFYLTKQNGYAALPYPINLNGDSFSISIWVRFYHASMSGTFLTVFIAKFPNTLTGVRKFISLDNNGLAVYDRNGQNPQRVNYQGEKANDGRWNYVVVTWKKDNGNFDVVVNSFRQGEINTDYTSTFAENVWVTLGADFDSSMTPEVDKGFRGYVSQLNVYNRALDFVTETPLLHDDPRKVFSGSILRWNEFIYHRGVQPVYPSSAQKQCSGSNCITNNKSKPIFKTPCPPTIYKVSADRLSSVSWTEPIPEGATSMESTYKTGDTFLWGKHTNVYAIRDSSGTSAFCSFNIYVMPEQCSNPTPPHLGTQSCERSYSPYFGCTVACTDASRRIDRYTPKVYTCGPTGAWNPVNRNIPIRYPSCGLVQNQAKKKLIIRLAYPKISTPDCEGVNNTMPTKIQQALASINVKWGNKICGQADCSDVTIVVTCKRSSSNGRRKRQVIQSPTTVDITIPQSAATLARSNPPETLTIEDILTRNFLESQLFDFSIPIPNGSPDLNSFIIDSADSCPSQQTVVDGYCVKCGPGNFYNNSTKICEDCPVGTYQNMDDQTSCIPCQQGSNTQTVASVAVSDCKTICEPGRYQTGTRCNPCGVGFYQSKRGMFYCNACAVGQTTRGEKSTNQSECYDDCNPGYELAPNGTCVLCPLGTYRTLDTPAVCSACPSDKTTPNTGSTKASDCSLTSCLPGTYRDGVPGTCVRCTKGKYQDEKWQTSCKSCGGVRYMTKNEGSTQKTDCIFFCESGQQVDNSTDTPTCVNCLVGTYKNNTVDPTSKCLTCPGGKLTPSEGSDSIDDCSIFRCAAGYRPNGTENGCEPCPYGTYQNLADQENCTVCPNGYSTYKMASTLSTDCKVYCESGKVRNEQLQICEACSIGYYKTNTDFKFSNCTRCPVDYVTSSTGSDDIKNCTVRDCPPGTKRQVGETGCDGCPRGQYQSESHKKTCEVCSDNTYTRNVNSTKASDCETFCPSGQEKSGGVCIVCGVGYFKDNTVDKFSMCTLCPLESITASNGSSSETQCTVANCSAGNYRDVDTNKCKPCDKGYYQPDQWQTSCIQCPTDKTTETTGSISQSMCQLQCSPGYEDISGTCVMCKIGYYKTEYKAALCESCPPGFITSEKGATLETNCTVPACKPGEYLLNNVCEKCNYDTYQPDKWQKSCTQCPTGYVTQMMGATNISDCVVSCPSGEQYRPVEKDCIACQQGYYRNATNRQQITCQMCPIDSITSGPRATSSSACNIKNCTTPGQFRSATSNQCTDCPFGTYGENKWLEVCIDCPQDYTTKQRGSIRRNDCIRDCPSGQYELQGVCFQCSEGTYRNKAEGFNCTMCPSGYTTQGKGSTSRSDCSITNCGAGEYFDEVSKKCELCSNGTYQDKPRSRTCKTCGATGYFTVNRGSTSITDCKKFCDTGNNNCDITAICNPTTNGFTCSCNTDYQGDGTNCTHLCDLGYCVYGTCIKSPTIRCDCDKGYTGNRCEIRKDPSKESQQQNETVIIASVSAGVALMILAILIVCCVARARNKPEKYSHHTDYTGGPQMMDKHTLYGPPFPTGPYDSYSMRSYSPGGSYRGVAILPEIAYDNSAYQGDPAIYQA